MTQKTLWIVPKLYGCRKPNLDGKRKGLRGGVGEQGQHLLVLVRPHQGAQGDLHLAERTSWTDVFSLLVKFYSTTKTFFLSPFLIFFAFVSSVSVFISFSVSMSFWVVWSRVVVSVCLSICHFVWYYPCFNLVLTKGPNFGK